jgi:hypothetical protein
MGFGFRCGSQNNDVLRSDAHFLLSVGSGRFSFAMILIVAAFFEFTWIQRGGVDSTFYFTPGEGRGGER